MGIPPSPGSLSKAPPPAGAHAALSPLCALSFFVYDGPSRGVFIFFLLVLFFSFSLFFLAQSEQR